jgi:hypothetical protein
MEKIGTQLPAKVEFSQKINIDAGTVFFDFLQALSGEMFSSDVMYFAIEGMRDRLLKRGNKAEDVDKAVKLVAEVLSSRRTKGTQEFMG